MHQGRIADFLLRRNGYAARLAAKMVLDVGLWAFCLTAAVWLRFDFSIPTPYNDLVSVIAVAAGCQIVVGLLSRLYLGRAPYGSFDEVSSLVVTVLVAAIVLVAFDRTVVNRQLVPLSTPIIGSVFMVAAASTARYVLRIVRDFSERRPPTHEVSRILVFGAGDGGVQAVTAMRRDPMHRYNPVGLLDDDLRMRHRRISNVAVLGDRSALGRAADRTGADTLLIAIPSATSELVAEIVNLVAEQAPHLKINVLPSLPELIGGSIDVNDIRELSDDDIIGRRQVEIDGEIVAASVRGRRVLVTGAGGSIGSELCRQIHRYSPAALIMVDRDESALHAVQLSIEGRALLDSADLVLLDIRDAEVVDQIFAEHKPHIVFHAAALKHLSLLERHPAEAVKTNIWGTLNVLDAALRHGVDRFVNMSTDKAANPVSVLGYCKRITERLTANVGFAAPGEYLSVRFGNVLGSRGSVLGVFQSQIAAGGPVTVTDPDVSRYFMTVAEAVRLVILAGALGESGNVMVLDMGTPVKVREVAQRLIAQSGQDIRIVYTGLRPGEKLDEELFGAGETALPTRHPRLSLTGVPRLDPARVVDIDVGQRLDKLVDALRDLTRSE